MSPTDEEIAAACCVDCVPCLGANPIDAPDQERDRAARIPARPIGKTAKGELVYSMKCDNLPAPPAPPPQAEVREAAPTAGADF